jgi:hypothetical protein
MGKANLGVEDREKNPNPYKPHKREADLLTVAA